MNPAVIPGDPAIPTSMVTVLIVAVVALSGVIAYLFKFYSKRLSISESDRRQRDEAMAAERAAWSVERTRLEGYRDGLRAEYDRHYRDALEKLYAEAREHESTARREYAANMEVVADKAAEAMSKVGAVLDKIYDRFIGPRRPH